MNVQNNIKGVLRRFFGKIKKHKPLVMVLSAVVVFVTTYSLILPAITIDQETAAAQGGITVVADIQEQEESVTGADSAVNAGNSQKSDSGNDNEKEAGMADSDENADSDSSEPAEYDSEAGKGAQAGADEEADNYVEQGTDKVSKLQLTYSDSQLNATAKITDKKGIPSDAVLNVTRITEGTEGYNYAAYMDALQVPGSQYRDYTEDNTLLFDVAVMDGDIEWEPSDSGKVEIKFDFKDNQLSDSIGADKSEQISVIHLPLKDSVREK